MYTVTALRLVISFSNLVYDHNNRDGSTWFEYFWMVYEFILFIIVLFTLFAVADHWKLRERAARQYNMSKEMSFVSIVSDMCRVHDHVAAMASVTMAITLFRVYRVIKYTNRLSYIERNIRASGVPILVIGTYALIITFFTWYSGLSPGREFLNSSILGRHTFNHSVFFSINVAFSVHICVQIAIVSIFIKYYVLSKLYLQPFISTNRDGITITYKSNIKYKPKRPY